MGEKIKLLMVDDEAGLCDCMSRYFLKRNYDVLSTCNGKEALRLIREDKPNLLLLDLKLGGDLEGKDVLRILRESDKDMKVIIISGGALDWQQMQEVICLGVTDFLRKPVDMRTLESVVIKALENSYEDTVRSYVLKAGRSASIAHDLSNIVSGISSRCELFILDTEEGLNKGKSEKERLDEAVNILKAVLKQTERFNEIIRKLM